jgi:hypothetical protein
MIGFADAVIKWMAVGGLVMYTGFALVLVRQAGVMAESIEDPFNGVIKLGAWLHFGLALLLVGLGIVIL